jgi:peptidoglycan/LPS O-acetylase OafA/YrhL
LPRTSAAPPSCVEQPQGSRHPGRFSYRPQLDGLRFIAIALVLFHHFVTLTTDAGNIGVRLFFVLSGFLITSILLADRAADGEPRPLGQALARFYARRTLRIFPAYYLVLVIAFLASLPDVTEKIWWHAAYLSNALFAVQGWFDWHTAHLWSLSLEEQFYIVWPLVLLTTRARNAAALLVVIILSSVLWRCAVLVFELWGPSAFVLPPAVFDSLGAGALLGIIRNSRYQVPFLRLGFVCLLLALCIETMTVIDAVQRLSWFSPSAKYLIFETALSLGCAWLVFKAYEGFAGGVGTLLEARPVRYLGKISYGIYLYHLFVPALVVAAAQRAGVDKDLPAPIMALLFALATIGVASLSWHFFEQPLNSAKDRLFPRRGRPPKPHETVPTGPVVASGPEPLSPPHR